MSKSLKDCKRLVIEVTEDHILLGRPHSPCYCPIALALKNLSISFNDSLNVDVGPATVVAFEAVWNLSNNACKFIRHFDSGHEVKPSRFYLSRINAK